jgi:drug/metabolite transporter (DMT)-like permease
MVVASAILLALQGSIDAKRVIAVVFAFLSGLCITCRIVLQKTYRLANDTKMTDIGYVIDEYLSMTFCALLTLLGLSAYQLVEAPDRLGDLFAALEYFRVELILFHPLYNFFSLMTLTFVASVTHSLLNVSKRVIGLLITLVWFHEPVTHRIMIGVVGAFAGGIWYTFEKRYAALETNRSFWTIELLRWPRPRPSGDGGGGIS